MMEERVVPGPSGCSKPLHVQRAEKALDLSAFLRQRRNERIDSSDDEEDNMQSSSPQEADFLNDNDEINDGVYYHESNDTERSWLTDILHEDESIHVDRDVSDEVSLMLGIHIKHKNLPYNKRKMEMNMYYGAGLISTYDRYHENKKAVLAKYPKRKKIEDSKVNLPIQQEILDPCDEPGMDIDVESTFDIQNVDEIKGLDRKLSRPQNSTANSSKKAKAKKFKDEESKRKWEEAMTQRRRKLFSSIVKKEISKQHRAKMNKHKEMLLQCKRVATQCQKTHRMKALQSARTVKELQWRMKRLARENIAYWKRSKRVDREMRKKLEKEAEEQRKMDFELIEAKRQQRKLNFLITQTELYAHFMSRKLGEASPEEQLRILSQLDEEKNPRLANIDDYDSEAMKAKAIKNAQDAFHSEKARTRQFDMEINHSEDLRNLDTAEGEHVQPIVFKGTLKAYQLRGMNWLANLYDQGISGILADEMGLGKTVQSIAFLSHLSEKHDLWGPFLVICPASTLHNWQQEFSKFVPEFKVVPYWGNPADRKILRQFWHQDGMHTKDAGFHVVITSYQIVISDVKYFNRIKWQYMVLDEAQAIKSTSSMRWKTLLGFNCRNRLLLSGTPIQNSMAELWALLHFIMPTLFDSHEEFNEWFSKDIESHAENKTGIDEKHLSRLHMILKPFMLRRIKKDVENELSDKIEVMVYCPLTTRQKLLYMALKQKIRIEDLLHYTVGGGDSHSVDKNFTSNLMNLVMQFRKVCNHPELFERRDAKSPIYFSPHFYQVPYLVYDCNVRFSKWQTIEKHFIFTTQYITNVIKNNFAGSLFNFCLSLGFSGQDIFNIMQGNVLHRWKCFYALEESFNKMYMRNLFGDDHDQETSLLIQPFFKLSPANIKFSNALQELVFTRNNSASKVVYTHTTHLYHFMAETIEHRNIRLKNSSEEQMIDVVSDEIPHKSSSEYGSCRERKPYIFTCKKTELPSFLFSASPKVVTLPIALYSYSRRFAYNWKRHLEEWSWKSLNYHWAEATNTEVLYKRARYLHPSQKSCVGVITPTNGFSQITIPDKETLVTDSGKLSVLDGLLKRLKEEGHRVLIYSQMTKMIDLLEEYMWHRHHKYMRLDGSSKISERRDMVADFQARTDIFVFLLSTRAGGLGINLTAADTVIFYDSDWNPTVDQQAMDRAHRLGQTKQVTVYRLICKGSIEERILQRAREKSEIQKLVISGGNFKPDTLKPKEVVSLLLDDEEIEQKYRQRAEERKHLEDQRENDRKYRKYLGSSKGQLPFIQDIKKIKDISAENSIDDLVVESVPSSPKSENSPDVLSEEISDSGFLDVEGINFNMYPTSTKPRPPRGTSKRGRPRGSRRVSALGRFNTSSSNASSNATVHTETPSTSDIGSSTPSSLFVPFETPASTASNSQNSTPSTTVTTNSTPIRRGPGRPRLKPGGPTHTGTRGSYRPRKPARPLPVPLYPSDGASSSTANANNSTSYSSYLYNFSEFDS